MREAFARKSFPHFSNKKYWLICDINFWNFNEMLTNDNRAQVFFLILQITKILNSNCHALAWKMSVGLILTKEYKWMDWWMNT